jgi:hypothetical protein
LLIWRRTSTATLGELLDRTPITFYQRRFLGT